MALIQWLLFNGSYSMALIQWLLFNGSYSTGIITKGLVDFMLGNTIESTFAAGLKLPANFGQRASKFVRDKTGAGEVYAHFIFPEHLAAENSHLPAYAPFIACMLDIIDDVNDFINGYIMWHICEDRYRLKEIGLAMRLGQDEV
jgi:hypothetical protein